MKLPTTEILSNLQGGLDNVEYGIQGDEIRLEEEKNEVIIHYFKQLYNGPKGPYSGESNGIFDFRVDARRGLERWATNKAAGIDEIAGEFYKNIRIRDILIERLQKHFTEYTRNMSIPDYFMKAKLILISKDGAEYPKNWPNSSNQYTPDNHKNIRTLYSALFRASNPVTKILKWSKRISKR